jgi:hypothetical protein
MFLGGGRRMAGQVNTFYDASFSHSERWFEASSGNNQFDMRAVLRNSMMPQQHFLVKHLPFFASSPTMFYE